jgi:predicted enzyme related to lactoylglutathione lyase
MQLFKGINVVSISVTDLELAREFYGNVLGLGTPLYDLPEMGWIEFSAGAPYGNIAVTLAEAGWQPGTGTTIVLNTDDCYKSCAALRAKDVRCDTPVDVPGYVIYCNFYDPFGNRLQMCSPSPAVGESPGESQARRLEQVYEQIAALLGQPEVAQRLRVAAGEDEWSVMQVLGHLVEMIPYWLGHCQVLIAAGEMLVFGRGPDAPERQAGVERGVTGEPERLLKLLEEEVQTAARAIRDMSTTERNQKGLNIRQGEMTVADIVERFIVAHAEDHLAQIQTTLQPKGK